MTEISEKEVQALAEVLLGRVNAPEQEIYRAARDGLEAAARVRAEANNECGEAAHPAPQPSGTVKVDDIAAIIYSEMEWASALPGDPGEPIISWDDCDDSPAFAKGRARAAARRILSALTAGKPEQSGWRLVPEEPTEEMYRAVYKVQDDCAIHNYGASPTFDDYWSAALSASPAAPTAGGGDA